MMHDDHANANAHATTNDRRKCGGYSWTRHSATAVVLYVVTVVTITTLLIMILLLARKVVSRRKDRPLHTPVVIITYTNGLDRLDCVEDPPPNEQQGPDDPLHLLVLFFSYYCRTCPPGRRYLSNAWPMH